MEIEPQVLSERTNDGDSLTSRLEVDTSQNEQTWPSEEEMRGSNQMTGDNGSSLPPAATGTTPKSVRKVKVPSGTSAYQAAWIVDENDGEEDEGSDAYMSEDNASDNEEMEAGGFRVPALPSHIEGVEEDDDDGASSSKRSVVFEDLDMEEEGRQ
jgi:pre-rRNA-processing protein TSR1